MRKNENFPHSGSFSKNVDKSFKLIDELFFEISCQPVAKTQRQETVRSCVWYSRTSRTDEYFVNPFQAYIPDTF